MIEKGIKEQIYNNKNMQKLQELREAIKNMSSYICNNAPKCSFKEVMNKLATFSDCKQITLFSSLAWALFTKKAHREIFLALKKPKYQIQWLEN